MRISSKWLAGITLLIVFGGIAISAWLGWWQTVSTKVPVKFNSEAFADQYNPADIRGSYTFGEVSTIFEIPLAVFKTAFVLPMEDVSLVGVNQLEELFSVAAENGMEIGTGSVQLFTAYYKGLPFETDEQYLPAPAVDLLKETVSLSASQLTYLESHQVSQELLGLESEILVESTPIIVKPSTGNEAVEQPPVSEEHPELTAGTIKGSTTFRNLLDWGVPQEKIEAVLGQPMPNALFTIKDFCLQEGLEFGSIKSSLQLEVPVTP